MDINARINWKPGMEITDQTFLELDANLDFRQQMALRAALGSARTGLLPGTEFNNTGMFVKSAFEMERFRCCGVLPSGRIVNADESVSVPIPMLFGAVYYLTVGFGQQSVEFEKEGVPYRRPQYEYGVHTLQEVEQGDLLPVARFLVDNGMFSLDSNYIVPSLLLSADSRYQTYIDTLVERLQQLTSHANLENGEGKRALLRYMFRLKGYGLHHSVSDFILLIQEVVQAVDYYIVTPNVDPPAPVELPSPFDVQWWLQWAADYLKGAMSILDTVELTDNTIDYDALLAQAKKELYERLNPELYDRLREVIKQELGEELDNSLRLSLGQFINEEMKPDVHDTLSDELQRGLYEKLYTLLFDNLYNALYVPTPDKAEFVPLI